MYRVLCLLVRKQRRMTQLLSSRNCLLNFSRFKKCAVNFAIIISPIPQEYLSNVISFLIKPPESISVFLLPLPEFRHHALKVRLLQEPLDSSPYIQSFLLPLLIIAVATCNFVCVAYDKGKMP